jgi:CheY-like chemotaxis protein
MQALILVGWTAIFVATRWQPLAFLLVPILALVTFFVLPRFPMVLAALFLSAYVEGTNDLQDSTRLILVTLIWVAVLVTWFRPTKSSDQSEALPTLNATIRHDLRTPANMIVGFCDILLSMSAREPMTPGQREHVEAIQRNGKTLQKAIDDLFAASGQAQNSTVSDKADTSRPKRPLILVDGTGSAIQPFTSAVQRYNLVPAASIEAIGQLDKDIHPAAILVNDDELPPLAGVVDKQIPIVSFSFVNHDKLEYLMKPVQFETLSAVLKRFGTAPRKVLIIDDSLDSASMMAHMVRSMPEHPQVVNAYSGREAIALLREQAAPDVIILDFVLPDMNGFSLLDYLRTEVGLAAIPILLVSAHRPQDILKQPSVNRVTISRMAGISPQLIEAIVAELEKG